MCNAWCLDFVARSFGFWPIDAEVLEVGSRNVNGTPRSVVKPPRCSSYVGVDLAPGPGVDVVCSAEALGQRFGPQAFDVVISTEMLEHVHDWRKALVGMLDVLRVNGLLIVTTRSPGFEYHPYPEDNWRFTVEDFLRIFVSPLDALVVERDPDKRNGRYSGVGAVVELTAPLRQAWFDHIEGVKVHTTNGVER